MESRSEEKRAKHVHKKTAVHTHTSYPAQPGPGQDKVRGRWVTSGLELKIQLSTMWMERNRFDIMAYV